MENFKVYNLGGSCCKHYFKKINDKNVFIKEIEKSIEGIDNGYKKFYYEVEHIKKYNNTGLFPKLLFINDTETYYSVGMEEYYEGATLSDLIRNPCVKERYFKESFSFILDNIYEKIYSKIFLTKPAKDYLEKCYFNRVLSRMEYIKNQSFLESNGFSNELIYMLENGCFINDEYYPPLSDYITYLYKDEKLKESLEIPYVCNMHYDLCPLNILVDANFNYERIQEFKLIDVRGEDETKKEYRHYMYDMGKMLLGLDCFDIFRIFNGKIEEACYNFSIESSTDRKATNIKFAFLHENKIAKRYKMAYEYFWEHMINRNYYEYQSGETCNSLETKFLFSQCMMYHPDIPCRIIYEKDENMAILLFMRGMIMIRKFMEEVYGQDPVGRFNNKINIWEGL